MILKAINKLPMPVYGDGKQIRDWLYVDDHVNAIQLILEKGKVGNSYNISGGNQISNIDVIKTICKCLTDFDKKNNIEYFDYESLIEFVKDRPGHDRRYALDSSKISKEFGWVPEHSFEDGINKTILWYIENYYLYKNKLDSLKRQGNI
jgi:dTDP-glucose 4,6-dehydratase